MLNEGRSSCYDPAGALNVTDCLDASVASCGWWHPRVNPTWSHSFVLGLTAARMMFQCISSHCVMLFLWVSAPYVAPHHVLWYLWLLVYFAPSHSVSWCFYCYRSALFPLSTLIGNYMFIGPCVPIRISHLMFLCLSVLCVLLRYILWCCFLC